MKKSQRIQAQAKTQALRDIASDLRQLVIAKDMKEIDALALLRLVGASEMQARRALNQRL